MNKEIKRYADTGDLKSLKYIFVDSLDVDPTFVRYEEEYNYCKSIPGLLETHRELTPFTQDKSHWTEEYWAKLKMDLLENFSDRRMMHMREVAKVYLAEKVKRILAEREERSANEVKQYISTMNKGESATNSVSYWGVDNVFSQNANRISKGESQRTIKEEIREHGASYQANSYEEQKRSQKENKNNQNILLRDKEEIHLKETIGDRARDGRSDENYCDSHSATIQLQSESLKWSVIFATEDRNTFILSSDHRYLCRSINRENKQKTIYKFKRVEDGSEEMLRLQKSIKPRKVKGDSGCNDGVSYKVYELRKQGEMRVGYKVEKYIIDPEEKRSTFFGRVIELFDDRPRQILVSEMYFISEK